MWHRGLLLLCLLALLSGLVVGYLQGGQAATANHVQASALTAQAADDGPTFSALKSYPAIVAQPLPNAAGDGLLSSLASTSGAMCDDQSTPP